MKTRLLVAALAASLALPAFAAGEANARRAFELDFNFDFDLSGIEILADSSAVQKQAENLKREYGNQVREWAQQFAEHMQGSMAYMFSDRVGRGKVVKGAPYSADVITETHQKLADGNVITHRKVSRVYRDSEGRTRQETFRDDKVRSVYISDPVAGASYTLLPDTRIAVRIPRVEPSLVHRHDSRTGDKVVVRTIEGSDAAPGTREEVRVQVIRMGDGSRQDIVAPVPPVPPVPPKPPVPPVPPVAPVPPVPPVPPMPGVNTLRFESTAHLGKGTTTSLGTKDVEGVKAEGKSTLWTIPAGKIGNRNAINVTSESWYSPELQLTVYSRHDDPRTGESIYRLAAVKRAEPGADLFTVPEGYETRGRPKRERPERPEKPEKPSKPEARR